MKTHVVLVNPAFMLKDGTIPGNLAPRDFPLGLGMLATILMDHGYTAEIVNANAHPDWPERVLAAIDRDDVAFVGFTCMSSQVYSAITLSKRIKERFPRLPIVFGGVHPTLIPESLVRTPWIDYCVVGEGDAVVVPLVDHLNGKIPLERVPNLCTTGSDGAFVSPCTPTTSRSTSSTWSSTARTSEGSRSSRASAATTDAPSASIASQNGSTGRCPRARSSIR